MIDRWTPAAREAALASACHLRTRWVALFLVVGRSLRDTRGYNLDQLTGVMHWQEWEGVNQCATASAAVCTLNSDK